MKTVFITIFDTFQLKNFFYTGFYDAIKGKCRLVVICSQRGKVDYFRELFKADPNIGVEGVPIKMRLKRWQKAFLHVKMASLNTQSGSSFFTERARAEGKWKKYLFYKFFNLFFDNSWAHALLHWLDWRWLPPGEFQYLFDKYRPDLVFSTNVISPIDVRLMKDAKRNRVWTVSNVKSWDTPTMKGFLVINADRLVVQNDIQKTEFMRYHQFPADKIAVLGNPGFDIYFNDKELMSREEFCKLAHLDPAKNIIFINISAPVINPFPEDPIRYVDRWISEHKISFPAQILISPRNKYGFSEQLANDCQNLIIHTMAEKLEGGTKENLHLDKWEIYDLKNCLYHADAVITTASTLAVEACLTDTPSISLGFDFQPVNYWLSAKVRNVDEHFMNVRKAGGVWVVENPEKLLIALNTYLTDPTRHQAERQTVARQQAQFLDDQSGRRVGEYLLSQL